MSDGLLDCDGLRYFGRFLVKDSCKMKLLMNRFALLSDAGYPSTVHN
jgi:hypothetical protein